MVSNFWYIWLCVLWANFGSLGHFREQKGKISWHRPDALSFQILGKCFLVSYTEFAILMRVYDEEFTWTTKYANLPLPSVPSLLKWCRLCINNLLFAPCSSKASTLCSPGLRMIYSLLSRLVTGRGTSMRVVTHRDFQYLISMANGVLLHLGFVLAATLHHQENNLLGRHHFCWTLYHMIGKGVKPIGNHGSSDDC